VVELILVTLLVVAVMVVAGRDPVVSVVLLGVFSLFSALLFFLLHAPDVALTEAAVGAGVSTFMFVWAIRKTRRSGPS